MSIKVAFIIDPPDQIHPHKDSSVALMLEAQRRKWNIACLQQQDISWDQGRIEAHIKNIQARDRADWCAILSEEVVDLQTMQVVFMRKDPPMNMNYMYTSYLLELLQSQGVLIVNDPSALRNVNEKLYTAWFPQCCVESMVSSQTQDFLHFLSINQDIIIKPLGSMGGRSIFRIKQGDPNTNVILETLTEHGQTPAMAQRFITQIDQGDKRLILINGEPVPYALARIPKPGETRGNLAAGARAEGRPLSERDTWLCQQIAPHLKKLGLAFVGLDVIGDYITEINVTSPTGIRELDNLFDLNISAKLLDWVETQIART